MQKTYLDAGNGKETTIKITGLGSFRSNYPALAFVVLGFSLAAWVVYLSYRNAEEVAYANSNAKADWVLTGSISAPNGFSPPDGKAIDWTAGILALEPSGVQSQISKSGQFEIRASIKQGTPIQEVYPTLIYTLDLGNMQVDLSEELHNYSTKQPTKIARRIDRKGRRPVTRIGNKVGIENRRSVYRYNSAPEHARSSESRKLGRGWFLCGAAGLNCLQGVSAVHPLHTYTVSAPGGNPALLGGDRIWS